MDIKVRYLDGVRFEAQARGHRVICDQPTANKGEDTGMTPPEFLLVSLGTCAGYYAAEYLRTRNLPIEGLEVNVAAEKASGPARLGKFKIEVHTPSLEARHLDGILRAVKACLIHNTLLHAPEVGIEIMAPLPAAAA